MKRDWDIIRNILLKLEHNNKIVMLQDFSKEKSAEYSYHVQLLIEARFIRGEMEDSAIGMSISDFSIESLTWEGHDFLDAIRNDTVWNKTKTLLKEKTLGMSFDIIKKIAINFAVEEMI